MSQGRHRARTSTPVFVTASGRPRPGVRLAGRLTGLAVAGYASLAVIGLTDAASVVDAPPLPLASVQDQAKPGTTR